MQRCILMHSLHSNGIDGISVMPTISCQQLHLGISWPCPALSNAFTIFTPPCRTASTSKLGHSDLASPWRLSSVRGFLDVNGLQWDSIGSPKISQKFTTGFKTGCIYSFVRLSAVVVLSPSTSPDPQDSQPVPWSQKNPKDASQHLPYKSQYQGRSSPRSPKSQAKWELELSHTISCRSCNWLTSRVKIMWFS